MRFLVLAALSVSLANTAHAAVNPRDFASEAERENYFTIDSVEVQESVPSKSSAAAIQALINKQQNHFEGTLPGIVEDITGIIENPADLTKWVQLGGKLFQVVLDNKPVANVATQAISILPVAAQSDWLAMENWQGPAAKTFTFSAKNLYGMTVISHTYTVSYNYGGQIGGAGQFIANATVIPSQVEVLWGFTLNSSVEVNEPINTGTQASPVPGVGLQLKYSMDSILKHIEGRDTFFIRGNGATTRVQ